MRVYEFTLEADSFDAALQMVLRGLHQQGLRAVRVEVSEQGLALLQEAI